MSKKALWKPKKVRSAFFHLCLTVELQVAEVQYWLTRKCTLCCYALWHCYWNFRRMRRTKLCVSVLYVYFGSYDSSLILLAMFSFRARRRHCRLQFRYDWERCCILYNSFWFCLLESFDSNQNIFLLFCLAMWHPFRVELSRETER